MKIYGGVNMRGFIRYICKIGLLLGLYFILGFSTTVQAERETTPAGWVATGTTFSNMSVEVDIFNGPVYSGFGTYAGRTVGIQITSPLTLRSTPGVGSWEAFGTTQSTIPPWDLNDSWNWNQPQRGIGWSTVQTGGYGSAQHITYQSNPFFLHSTSTVYIYNGQPMRIAAWGTYLAAYTSADTSHVSGRGTIAFLHRNTNAILWSTTWDTMGNISTPGNLWGGWTHINRLVLRRVALPTYSNASQVAAFTTAYAPVPNGIIPTPAQAPNTLTNAVVNTTIEVSANIATPHPPGPHGLIEWRTGLTDAVMSTTATSGTPPHLTLALMSGTLPPHASGLYTTIGQWITSIRATDGHGDRTTAPVQFRVYSTDELPLKITYGSSTSLVAIRGDEYDMTAATRPCGGEEGWTRFPLTFTAGNPAWTGGAHARVLSSNATGFATVTNNSGDAVRQNHHTNTLFGGNSATAQATVVGSPAITLSAAQSKSFKIDRDAPVANVTHLGGTNFVDASTDALSDISTTRRTKVALVVGAGTPADSDYHELDAVPPLAPGTYRLWVWATDKAGNEHRVMRNASLYISGEVSISKETDKGATLHIATCVNHNQIVISGPCTSDCQIGANAEVVENTELTYILTLKNSDTSTNATGTFIDALPSGFVPIGIPTHVNITGSGNISGVSTTLSGGIHTVTGNYTLGANAEMEIHIRGNVPAYDTGAGASNIFSNQANITWTIGSSNGTEESNYANHRVNQAPSIHKATNWGGAVHVDGCPNTGSLSKSGTCAATCVAGAPGTVQEGDIISYQLTLHNPSNILQYFATDAIANYDLLPTNLDMTGQTYKLEYIDAGGVTTTPFTGTIAGGGTSIVQGSPYVDGTFVGGLTMGGNRIYQQGGSAISIAPKASVILTVSAKVEGDTGDILTNQAISGFSTTGSNTANLRLSDTGVETIKSKFVTHQIESGTVLTKWAYSATPGANNPTTHHALCPDFGNILALGSCTGCNSGSARLQNGNIITYSLTMDNSENTHVARDLSGNVTNIVGLSSPGIRMRLDHLDNTIPEGLTPDVTTLRAYITDAEGNNVTSFDGFVNSTAQTVNEGGVNVSRQVLSLSSGNTNIIHVGNAALLFELQGLNLTLSGTQWTWEVTNIHHHARSSIYDQGSYSITYLFDAEVTGSYDESVPANNIWVNKWEQQNPLRVHNPETPTSVTTPADTVLHSNTTVHARVAEGVETKITKVGADNLALGLSGAEFALYKWDGALAPTTAEANYMVDPSVLVDTGTMPGGEWIRVKENGEDAALTDFFVSGTSPLGEIDFGKLQTGVYTLIETKAPNSYELPVGQWILTIDGDKGDTGVGDYKIEFVGKTHTIVPPAAIRETSGGIHTYKLINARPFSIGMSGLGGNTGLLLAGFMLMALTSNAYIFVSYQQRKQTKKQTSRRTNKRYKKTQK